MDRARLLAELDRQLLEAYSRRTTSALQSRLPLPTALPWLDRLLLSNVEKEVRKDAAVIRRAVDTQNAGQSPDERIVGELLQIARAIDRDFLAQAKGPLEIPIRYEVIEPVRAERIRRLFEATQRLAAAWQPPRKLRAAFATVFPGPALERLLFELMVSYARETQALGESVRMPALLSPLRRRVLAGLYETMEKAAAALAREAADHLTRTSRRRA
ncbi:MAG: hypothetical protein HXY29_08070 [Rhodocyclaceae bacterium]|jgi:hypothetical protein|nr:hypothetical protein [Rhodocyclaceae bacterium]